MHEIFPNQLWGGHAMDVRSPQAIFQAGVRCVVDLAYEEPTAKLPRQLIYCRFPLNDGGGNEPPVVRQALRTCCDFLSSNMPTLVACSAGMSRSPTIAAFALAHFTQQSPELWIEKISAQKGLELKPELWKQVAAAYLEL